MEESVLFRSLIESLSINEFNIFSSRLFSKFNKREILTNGIFHLLAYQGRNELKNKYSNNINKILINIIHSRNNDYDDNNNEDVDIEPKISITNLSYDLISNIGSFLVFKDLTKYRLSNRHIYISCKQNPSSITKIPTNNNNNWYNKYISNNFGSIGARIKQLKQFKFAKILTLTGNNFDHITNNNTNPDNFVWKDVRKLHLSCINEYNYIAQTNKKENKSWTDRYQHILKSLKNLTHLTMNSGYMELDTIYTMLTVPPNLRYCTLTSYSLLKVDKDRNIEDLLKNSKYDFSKIKLEGISMHDYLNINDKLFFRKLLAQIDKNLKSFEIEIGSWQNPGHSSFLQQYKTEIKFNNLEEISIRLRNCSSRNQTGTITWYESFNILKKMIGNKLERLELYCPYYNTIANANDGQFISNFIDEILKNHKSLRYLKIHNDNGVVLRTIINHLIHSLKINNNLPIYECIKIDFNGWNKKRWDSTTRAIIADYRQFIEENTFKLIEIMNKSVSNNFVIRFGCPWCQGRGKDNLDEIGWERMNEKLIVLRDEYNVEKLSVPSSYTIVTRKNVDLYGGYHTDWLMR